MTTLVGIWDGGMGGPSSDATPSRLLVVPLLPPCPSSSYSGHLCVRCPVPFSRRTFWASSSCSLIQEVNLLTRPLLGVIPTELPNQGTTLTP